MARHDGFPGQRLRVLPDPLLTRSRQEAGTRKLLVTDCGFFPRAVDHGRKRDQHGPQVILIACVSGGGWCDLAGTRHDVSAGQVLVIPPGIPHSYGASKNDPWSIWWLHATGDDVGDLLGRAKLGPSNPVITPWNFHQVATLMEEVLSIMERDESPAAIMAAAGAAWYTLSLLSQQNRFPSPAKDPVAQATTYIDSQLEAGVSVAEVSRIVGLSQSYLSALFNESQGTGILEYQTRRRMALARELLDSTDLPIAAVSRRVGYSDAYYFSRQFRKYHLLSPSQYRSAPKG